MPRASGYVVCAAVLVIGALTTIGASAQFSIVEDWHAQPVGTSGIPLEWYQLPLTQRVIVRLGALEIVLDEGQRALRLTTDATQHTILRKKITADLTATPMLQWRWKVVTFPTGADLRDRSRSDSSAVLAVTWRRPPRVLAYAWDVSAPAGSRFVNPKQSRVHYIIVRSGTADRGKWMTERRDVVADYTTLFGNAPTTTPEEVEISVDSNDTRSRSETLLGDIRFVPCAS
jgi:hypothetical protein